MNFFLLHFYKEKEEIFYVNIFINKWNVPKLFIQLHLVINT